MIKRLISISIICSAMVSTGAFADPKVTFVWDAYPVDATQNTGADKFILETKIGAGVRLAEPVITPITTTTYTVDLAGRPKGNTVTGRIKACRPGSFANPPRDYDECSGWSNEATKWIGPPKTPIGFKPQ